MGIFKQTIFLDDYLTVKLCLFDVSQLNNTKYIINKMNLNTDPSVSLFITDIKKKNADLKHDYIFNELKKISAKDELSLAGIWKRLYILNKYGIANSLDFIKACADQSLPIKRLGYQGILLLNPPKNLLLIQNLILKDSENPKFGSEILSFIGNLSDPEKIMSEVVSRIPKPPEFTKAYLKYLIAKSKYEKTLIFSLISDSEIKLLVKLQIVLDNSLESQIDQRDISWLKHKFPLIKCAFTKTKTMQLIRKLYLLSKIDVDAQFIQTVRSFLIHPSTKIKKQIEVALSLECIQFLIITKHFPERIEEFMFRLINSENPNSRFLGLKYGCIYKIIPEIQISKILEIGVHHKICFDTLMKLMSKDNIKIIYHKLNQKKIGSALLKEILKKVCDFADCELIYKVLLDHPEIYEDLKNTGKLIKECAKDFFEIILRKDSPKYFKLIYDLFPEDTKSDLEIAELGANHLLKLISTNVNLYLLDSLMDFLCVHGSPEMNRNHALDMIKCTNIDAFYKSIEAFNMVLTNKLIFVGESNFIKYSVSNSAEKDGLFDLLVEYPENIDVDVFEINRNTFVNVSFESFISNMAKYTLKKFKNISSKSVKIMISRSNQIDKRIIKIA